VRGACEILGLDKPYVANDGRFIAATWSAQRTHRASAAIIDRMELGLGQTVVLEGLIGEMRAPDVLTEEQVLRLRETSILVAYLPIQRFHIGARDLRSSVRHDRGGTRGHPQRERLAL
jgi:hypothetical protein